MGTLNRGRSIGSKIREIKVAVGVNEH
jgi:hypothetical protein